MDCPSGQVYKTCGDSCTMTCQARRDSQCKSECIEGCMCQEGWSKNAMGACVPITKCPCFVNGAEYVDGHFELTRKGGKYEAW
jgi:hypothetical protein